MNGKWLAAAVLAMAGFAGGQYQLKEIPETTPGPAPADSSWAGKKWKVKFFHDQLDSAFQINDFQFAGLRYGFAAGFRTDKEKVKPVALVTRDGGETWAFVPLKAPAISIFPLDETHVWVVTDKDLYISEEGGAQWKKLKRPDGVTRVFFKDAENGWAYGAGKTIYRTKDGAKTWEPVAESKSLELTNEHTSFNWMDFVSPKVGVAVGNSERPRDSRMPVPDWMDPGLASMKRQVPTTTVLLETRDGGETWKPSVSSIFGRVVKIDLHVPWSLSLFRFHGSFEFPAEVVEIDITNGKSRPLFRRKDLNVTDIAMLSQGRVVLAGVELAGKFKESPIPSKVRVAATADRVQWTEMEVDYRAYGNRAMLAWVDDDHAWMATDAGMILRLEKK